MKTIVTALLTIAVCVRTYGQLAPQIMAGDNIQRHPRGFISTFPGPPPGITGTSYLYEHWSSGTILLTDDKVIEDVAVKIDLQNKLIEIDHNGQIKVLEFGRVKAIDLRAVNGKVEHLVNGKTLAFADIPMDGFFSFVKDGKYNLLLLTRVVKMAPNYNAALDMGSKDYQMIKEKQYFIMKDNVAVPVDKSKKKFSGALKKAFGEDFDKKLEKVKVGKEPSLVSFVSTLNSSSM
jgi:hypothetical protein